MIFSEAPSNIALIKYMGKQPGQIGNLPTNSSLSVTLPNFRTRVQISSSKDNSDLWTELKDSTWNCAQLSTMGQERYLKHFSKLKKHWKLSGNYLIQSGNNFPTDCGVASSASSFAALTMATYQLAKQQDQSLDLTQGQLAKLSRNGSGSSCRSFGGPLVLWNAEDNSVEEFSSGFEFQHELILVDVKKKEVSSSEAHKRVLSSPKFSGRPERANARLKSLLGFLSTDENTKDWQKAWQLVWDEMWDMHELFHTAQPSFEFMAEKSKEILEFLRKQYLAAKDGPFITMDAGANIHLLYRKGQKSLGPELQKSFGSDLKILKGLL